MMLNKLNAERLSKCPYCNKALTDREIQALNDFLAGATGKGGVKSSEQSLAALLSKQLIKHNFSGRQGQGIQYLVIHDTGNARSGADALAHQKYFGSGNKNASAHYFVDSKRIVQVIEDAQASWHCGDGYGKYGISNQNSIGIELCINSDGDYGQMLDHAVLLIRHLADQYKIPKAKIVRHYDASRKICPGTMSANNWQKWQAFLKRLG